MGDQERTEFKEGLNEKGGAKTIELFLRKFPGKGR